MRYRIPGSFLLICGLLSGSLCHAEISLLDRNPFGLGDGEESTLVDTTVIEKIPRLEEELEFCGSHTIGGTRKFSLLTKQDNKKHWMTLAQSIGDFKLVKYNEDTRSLLVEFAGKFDILPLRKALRPAVPSKHVIRRQSAIGNPSANETQDSPDRNRRRIIPRTEKPPKVLPATPQFPEKLPSPPKRV